MIGALKAKASFKKGNQEEDLEALQKKEINAQGKKDLEEFLKNQIKKLKEYHFKRDQF